MNNRALEGIRIIDFGHVIVGGMTTGVLASYGAEVIKVESQNRVEHNRTSPPFKEGNTWLGDRSGMFANIPNAGKYSITLNLKHPRGFEILKKLIAMSDVVFENYKGGHMEKWGLDYENLKKVKPDIIMLSAAMFGQTGPYKTSPGIATTLLALSGIAHLTGRPKESPMYPSFAYTDFLVPRLTVLAIVAALDYRRRTGKGQYIDLAQFEAALHFITPAFLEYSANGRELERIGNRSTHAAPCGVYRCKGDFKWCVITVCSDEEWKCFVQVIGRPTLTMDPRFSTLLSRLHNVEELDRLTEEWTIKHTPEEVMNLMQNAGIAAGVVQNGEDLAKDPQLKSRDYFHEIKHQTLGNFVYSGMPVKLSKTPYEIRNSPCFGEHNEYVYTKILGMSDEEFTQSLQEGIFE